MRAIVVRHYKTLNNESNQIMGWGDAPRAKSWRADLAYVDEILEKHKLQFSSFYTSCLERSRQTGNYYAKSRSISQGYGIKELNEINYGLVSEKSKLWVEKHIPQHKLDPDYIYPEGESFRQMQKRSVEFLESLNGQYNRQTILLVTHAGVIRGLISHFLNLPFAQNLKRQISHRYIGDFWFENNRCVHYDELGVSSGFILDNTIKLPWTCL